MLLACLFVSHDVAYAESKLALGDSLALGFGEASHVKTIAKVGASSCAIASMVPHQHFDVVLISAGTNDPPGPCVHLVRMEVARFIHLREVIWLLPINNACARVSSEAVHWQDKVVRYLPSRKHWPHPSAYHRLF
jgi:hypothetical protein